MTGVGAPVDLAGRTPLGWLPQMGGKEETIDLDCGRAALIAEVSFFLCIVLISRSHIALPLAIPQSMFYSHISIHLNVLKLHVLKHSLRHVLLCFQL